MDFALLIPLAPFLMVVGIVWVKSHAKLEEKRIAANAAGSGEFAARQADELAELRERVRVLERIVTDGGYDLAHKIEALRDPPSLSGQRGALQPANPEKALG